MSDPDVEAVAKGLTKAQRRAVEFAEFHEAYGAWHPAGWYATGDKRVRWRLCLLKLTPDYLRRTNRLTPLGQAVREHLLAAILPASGEPVGEKGDG